MIGRKNRVVGLSITVTEDPLNLFNFKLVDKTLICQLTMKKLPTSKIGTKGTLNLLSSVIPIHLYVIISCYFCLLIFHFIKSRHECSHAFVNFSDIVVILETCALKKLQ